MQKSRSQPTNVDFARQALIWRIDALGGGRFSGLVFLIVAGCAWQWWRLLRGTKPFVLHESEFVSLAQLPLASR